MNPATYWWQGLARARLDPAVELCINRNADKVMAISELEDRYLKLFDVLQDSRSKSLDLFCNPLYNFRLEHRPVYWRMLMCQLLIYRRISHLSRLAAEVLTSPHFDFDRQDIDSLQRSGAIEDELLNSSLDAALQYTGALLKRD